MPYYHPEARRILFLQGDSFDAVRKSFVPQDDSKILNYKINIDISIMWRYVNS